MSTSWVVEPQKHSTEVHVGAGNGRAVLTASEEGELRSPHETLKLRVGSGPPPNSTESADSRPGGPAPIFPPEPCRFLWRLSFQVSYGDEKAAPPANPASWDQPPPSPKPSPLEYGRTAGVRAKGRKREEAREREGKDTGRRQVIWNQTSGDILREAGEQVLAGGHSSPRSWKAGMPTLILAQT